ncbi:MAG: flagellar motor protein MotB, partial [Myxococcales bacterium]|nr:flagellar motor protein MotB [Myxococcales bacterium]
MAKRDESEGVTVGKVAPAVGGRPPRRFPWRLLLWAILMTGAAGAGGYFAWQYRESAKERGARLDVCSAELGRAAGERDTATTQLTTCQGDNAQLTTRQQEIDAQLSKMEHNLDATREELTALRAARAEAEKRIAAMTEIQKQFAEMIDTGQLAVTSRRGNLVVELPAEVLFSSGSADLSKKGELAVLEVGIILKKFLDRRFLVVGHTDNLPLKGSVYKDNWELSTARALTVTRFLVQAGMNPANLVAAGAGEHDPAKGNDTAAGRQHNRRIEIVLMPALSELPPLPASLGAGDDG